MGNAQDLYTFKYSATDVTGAHINSSFVAFSIDDLKIFLETLGYSHVNILPLKAGSKVPDLKKKLNVKFVYEDFLNFYQSLKGGNNLFSSVIFMVNNCNNDNKSIYLRFAYFMQKGYNLSTSMKLLGENIIPNDIIEAFSKADSSGEILPQLDVLLDLYHSKRKKSFMETIFGKSNQSASIDKAAKDALSGIGGREKSGKTATLYPFKYKAVSEMGKKVSGSFEAETIDDCKHFLELQGYTNIKIVPRSKLDIDIEFNAKLKAADLSFDLTQLSTYIKSGISLIDGVTILAKQAKKSVSKKIYQKLVYDLLKGYSLSVAMDKQGEAFPQLLINMVRSAEMTGDLPSILDDMADYYEGVEQTKKTMKSAMTYPILVLTLAIGVFIFMLMYLVPQFITLYESNGASLPGITLFVIGLSSFIQHSIIYLILGIIIVILIFYLCYRNIFVFRKAIQTATMKMPIFGNIIIYNEVYTFTKTFASLINHGVFITDSMEILSKITNNEVYKAIIAKTLSNLAKGDNISKSFKNEWAFPTVAYHMLVTGENTGQLGLMMEKVSEHYQQLHKALVDQLKGLIEPIMILVVAGIVGVILVSIITPMFSIYEQVQ
ncbi:MAG: type II secretion system F family protein [Bacilli bacterium]|nr:type II secretion system F family protein [Bacilli bacterium]